MHKLSLNSAYPLPGYKKQWKICALVTVFVTLFLLVFQPFGLGNVPQPYRTPVILGFGLVTLLGMVLVYVVWPLLIPGFFREDRWTVGRSLLQLMTSLLVIATGNLLLAAALGFYPFSWSSYFQFIGITMAVGVFPGAASFFISHNLLLQKYLTEAGQLNAHIYQQQKTAHDPEVKFNPVYRDLPNSVAGQNQMVSNALGYADQGEKSKKPDAKTWLELRDEEGRLVLQLAPNELLCLTAEDNYTEVFYLQKGELKKELIRNTLKNMEEMLGDSPRYFRCHRSFAINLSAIEEVTGNAQGYKVKLPLMKQLIPVSRSRSKEFSERLEQQLAPKP